MEVHDERAALDGPGCAHAPSGKIEIECSRNINARTILEKSKLRADAGIEVD
jgi:hypothetical protein